MKVLTAMMYWKKNNGFIQNRLCNLSSTDWSEEQGDVYSDILVLLF